MDLSKAFDSIDRQMLWEMLRKLGAPHNFIQLIKGFHTDMHSEVLVGGARSTPFSVETGVKQGCVLASTLFSLYITAITILAHRELQPNDGIVIEHRLDGSLFNLRRLQAHTKTSLQPIHELQYADDSAITASSPEAMQRALNAYSNAYTAMGLTINPNKTEVLQQHSGGGHHQEAIFNIDGEPLKNSDSFKYLGSKITKDCNLDCEIESRISSASAAFGRLRKRVFNNNNLKVKTKAAVYHAVCLSTLLYAAETWTPYRRHIKKLEAFYTTCLKRILGVTWKDRVTYDTIFERTASTTIETHITRKHLRWIGHVIRMPEDRLPRQTLYGQIYGGSRTQGGQRKRYKDHTKLSLKKCGIDPGSLERKATNRVEWKRACKIGLNKIEDDLSNKRDERRIRRHERRPVPDPAATLQCQTCNRTFSARIGLISHMRWHQRNNQ